MDDRKQSTWKLDIPVVSIIPAKKNTFIALSKYPCGDLSLLFIDPHKKETRIIGNFSGDRGFMLSWFSGQLLISLDNKLLLSKDMEKWTKVLELKKSTNFIWHTTLSRNAIYAQEYGEETGIYRSKMGRKWKFKVRNKEIDEKSRHFHDLIYDPFRDILVTTLGDGNLVRVAISNDEGNTWRPVYKGPWQSVPIVVSKSQLVFGLDSGITSGGVLIWRPDLHTWMTIHLRWRRGEVKHAQMSDLRLLRNGLWIAVLGTPQAIIVSTNLAVWYPIYIHSYNRVFNHEMCLAVAKDSIAFGTGESMIVVKKLMLDKLAREYPPIMTQYEAWLPRLKGWGFSVKHKLSRMSRGREPIFPIIENG